MAVDMNAGKTAEDIEEQGNQNESTSDNEQNNSEDEQTIVLRKTAKASYEADKEHYTDIFNRIYAGLVDSTAEDKKPAFRLYEDTDTGSLDIEEKYLEKITSLLHKIEAGGYIVEIVEDLDVIDVTSDERFEIRITNSNSGVSYRFSLNKYREDILNYDFSPDVFILDIIKKIEGAGELNQLKSIKDDIVEFLSYAIHFKQMFRLEYSKIGWDRYEIDNKTRIFKYDNIISRNENIKGRIKSAFADELAQSIDDKYDENKEHDWYKFTIQLMNRHVHDDLLFAVGISGVVRQVLTFTKENNLNINIQGEPASGKSTIGHYILSFWGNPDALEGSSIDTENAAEQIRVRRPVMPYVLDERMMRYMDESDKKKKTELLLEVFREYEGREKERLGNNDRTGGRVYGAIISSSVDSMLDLLMGFENKDYGQYRRFIEFNIGKASDKVLFDKNEAVRAENIANNCYGYGIRYVVDYMQYRLETDDSYFQERYDFWVRTVRERLENEQNDKKLVGAVSSSMRFALVMLSYEVLREAFLYKYYMEIKHVKNTVARKPLEQASDYYAHTLNKSFFREILEEDDKQQFRYFKSFEMDFEKFMDEFTSPQGGVIKDYTKDVLDLLVDNLCIKLGKVSVNSVSKTNLVEYITRARQEQPDLFCADIKDFDPEVNLCAVDDLDGNINITFIDRYNLDVILFGERTQDIPISEIKEAGEKKDGDWKRFYKDKTGATYREVRPTGVNIITSNPKDGEKKIKIIKLAKQERVTIIQIPLTEYEDNGEE